MRIDRNALQALFSDVDTNLPDIQVNLHTLACIIANRLRVDGMEHHDLQAEVWGKLNKTITKFKPDHGDAYSYFFKVGIRHAYALLRNACKDHRQFQDYVEGGGPKPRTKARPTSLKGAIKLLDQLIRVTARKLRQAEEEEHQYLMAGLSWLQRYRYVLTGQYVPLTTATTVWSRSTVANAN